MARWKKFGMTLKPNHGWRCSPGHCLCVIGRGLMQFEYPGGWITIPGETSIKLHDRQPPDDDIVLEVSANPLPPTQWERVSLTYLLQESLLNTRQQFIPEEEVGHVMRPDLDLAWAEYRAMETDPKDGAIREAVWRQAICHTNDVFGVLTYGFWSEHYERADPVWHHTINSIIMDRYVEDPTQGPKFH
jgi:hypothetical protein